MKKCHITFQLNGMTTEVLVNPNQTLVRMLREDLGLTGTKYGCGEGVPTDCQPRQRKCQQTLLPPDNNPGLVFPQ